MKYTNLFSRSDLYHEISEGYVRINLHELLPIGILTYTEKATYENRWNAVTTFSRGAVVDWETGEIVAWPLAKFHNSVSHGEGHEWAPPLPKDEPFVVFEKEDGSMITVFHYMGRWMATSKGSFTSDQAKWAQDRINKSNQDWLGKDITYCAEAIYPANRVVVDNGDREDLVLFAARNRRTGAEIPLSDNTTWACGSVVRRYGMETDLSALEQLASEGRNLHGNRTAGVEQEGYVIQFRPSGVRAKVKLANYLAAHGVVTNATTLSVWRLLSSGQDLSEALKIMPDELMGRVQEVADELIAQKDSYYQMVWDSYWDVLGQFPGEVDRKTFAGYARSYKFSGVLFALLDGNMKAVDDWSWKQVRPFGSTSLWS